MLYNYCVSALSLYIEMIDFMIRSKQHDYYSTTPKNDAKIGIIFPNVYLQPVFFSGPLGGEISPPNRQA